MDTAEDFLLRYFLGEKDMLENKEMGNKGGEKVNKEQIMQEDAFVYIEDRSLNISLPEFLPSRVFYMIVKSKSTV